MRKSMKRRRIAGIVAAQIGLAERRQDIIEHLCEVRFETRANLMFRYSVSKNTIDRDLQALSCKYHIFTKQGNGGGVHIMDGFQLGIKYFRKIRLSFSRSLRNMWKGISGKGSQG